MHPDGGMFPGLGTRISDIADGTAHTILCVETIDDTQSVWTLGTDVTLVGLPYVRQRRQRRYPIVHENGGGRDRRQLLHATRRHRQIRR